MAFVDWSSCLPNGDDVAQIACLEPLFENVLRFIIAIAGIGLFLMLVMGGFNFLFAGGDQKKLEKAKGTITGAIIGLVIIAVAYLILLLIKEFTGVDVTKFSITIIP